jgi:hypothetical protein
MTLDTIQTLFETYKEPTLKHRYITNAHIEPLFPKLKSIATVATVGESVLGAPIYSITVGKGAKKILMWSQMHGNESTTTKALFDFLNLCSVKPPEIEAILNACTLCILPILSPDGAKAYTRVNANAVDLNRDAQERTQPESKVLRAVFESFQPDFCYNLHGQRTIFSAGITNKSAIVSFLAPARKVAMEIIAEMRRNLQELIPEHIGVYDDAFNINCVGDTFQSENVPTLLFEAGHHPEDYGRDKTRALIFVAYLSSLNYIATTTITGAAYKPYLEIPENGKCFFDIIIRNAKLKPNDSETTDIAIQFEERLINDVVKFIPIVRRLEDLTKFYGHKEYDAKAYVVTGENNTALHCDSENVCVHINNEKIVLFPK